MTIEELYWFTRIYEALQAGQKVSTRDINTIYELIPGAPKMMAKNGKIKMIKEHFDKVATETLQKYLVDQQLKKQQEDGNLEENK